MPNDGPRDELDAVYRQMLAETMRPCPEWHATKAEKKAARERAEWLADRPAAAVHKLRAV